MALERHRNSRCWTSFKVYWEQKDHASRGWKSWILLNFFCHIHSGEFSRPHYISYLEPVVREQHTLFVSPATTWDTDVQWDETWWETGQVFPEPFTQQEWTASTKSQIFGKDEWCTWCCPCCLLLRLFSKSMTLAALLSYQMLQSWRSTGPICNTAEVMACSCLSPLVSKPPPWMWVLRACQSGISTEIFVFKAVCTLCIPWSCGIETSRDCSVSGQEVPWKCWIMKQTPARSFHFSWSALHYTNGGVPRPQIWEEILETDLQEE